MADGSPLISLPEGVLREVVSWSEDGAAANALVSTCRTARQQRHDPATAALLLMRCPSQQYTAVLATWAASCRGGLAAVVQQLLQLVGASPDSGGPMVAPTLLLQAALYASAAAGDDHAIRALMASRQPPDANAEGGRAAHAALRPVVHMAALQALLECGADPFVRRAAGGLDHASLFEAATHTAQLPGVLLLLLRHCSEALLPVATSQAFYYALSAPDTHALRRLLHEAPAAATSWAVLLSRAAGMGALQALTLLLDHRAVSGDELGVSLVSAAAHCRVACAALLLSRGAAAAARLSQALGYAICGQPGGVLHAGLPSQRTEAGLRAMLSLLLRHGAVLLPGMAEAAEARGHGQLLTAVVQEVAAAAVADA